MLHWVFILVGFALGMLFGGCLVYAGLYRAARIMAQVQGAIDTTSKLVGL